MTKICLNMIVRNESTIIQRCLEKLIEIIDYVVITDTGSTDSTINIIEKFLVSNSSKISGKVFQDQWVNFGINRTNSVINAKKYLKLVNYPLDKIYLLFIDADMILETNNFKKSDLKLDYYLIKQYNSQMSYYNIRLAKASLDLKYKSVTHEYLDISPSNATSEKLSTLKINDIGDGGCKTVDGACSVDKFERDIKLLIQGIKDEPENSRYYFYLAQSYKDSGRSELAIKNYKKRAQMGGWVEEIFFSYLSIGLILYPKPECVEYFIKSFESSGSTRAEGLYWLAKYYISILDYSKAYNYLVQAIKLPYPSDQVLFINDLIYSIELFKELGICAHYVNKKHLGLITCDYVKFIDKTFSEQIKQIQTFYLSPLNSSNSKTFLLNPGHLPKGYYPSNSCFKLIDTKTNTCEGILRTVNYKLEADGTYKFNTNVQTVNYWCVVDIKENKITKKVKIELDDNLYTYVKPIHISNIKGLEDGRYIKYRGKLYASFVSLEYGLNPIHSIVLAHINSNFKISHIIPLRYNNKQIQKNWLPVEYKGKLCFIYSYDPFVLIQANVYSGYCSEVIKCTYNHNFTTFRGSAGPVNIGSKQLVLIHEVGYDTTGVHPKRTYFHRFLEYDSDFHLQRISEPFYFNKLGIEFCITLIYLEKANKIILYHTIYDNQINMIEIEPENISWLPYDLKENIISSL